MSKVDYKKDFKALYLPNTTPTIIDVPPMAFIMVEGSGAPQEKDYQDAISLLYSLSYALKMRGKNLAGYYDYVVFPLEGLWWCEDDVFDFNKRDKWHWIAMIRQPEFVTTDSVKWATEVTKAKKPGLDFTKARFELFHEGVCVQMMHVGPYANEPVTIEKMKQFMQNNGLVDATGADRKHHELYMSDPRKTSPEKTNTVIRLPVEVATTAGALK